MVLKEATESGQPLTVLDGIAASQYPTIGLTLTREMSSMNNDKIYFTLADSEWDTGSTGWSKASDAITEAVDHPPHYNNGDIETIDYIVDVLGPMGAVNYCHGNVLKYTGSRLFNKDKPVQDARKAIWYLNKMVELLEEDERDNS